MHHAVQLVDAVVARLGDRAWLDARIERPFSAVHVIDPMTGWVVAQPLVLLKGNTTMVAPAGAFPFTIRTVDAEGKVHDASHLVGEPVPPPSPPPLLPKGPEMRGANLHVTEGAVTGTLAFDNEGVLRPIPPVKGARLVIGEVAAMMATLDAVGRSTIRVSVPDSSPAGPGGAVGAAIARLRQLLADPQWEGSRFVVVDGWDGAAVEVGDDAKDTITRWQASLFRNKPQPPKPLPPPAQPTAPPPPGAFTVSFSSQGPGPKWPPATPKNVPGVLFELPPLDREVPGALRALGFTRWTHLVGAKTGVTLALARDEDDGMTVVGEDALALATPEEIVKVDEVLASKLEEFRSYHAQVGEPCPWDEADSLAMLAPGPDGALVWAGGSIMAGLGPKDFDGDHLVARVGRLRVGVRGSGRWKVAEGTGSAAKR
jgi:hypothetical protein